MQVCLRLHAYSPPAEPKAGVYDSIYIMQPLETKHQGPCQSLPQLSLKCTNTNSMATSVTNCTYEAQNNFSIGMIVSTLAETWTTQNKRAEEHVRNLTEVNVLADC